MTEMTKIKSSRTVGFAFDSTALPISIHMNFRFAIRCRCRWVECFVIADVYQVAAEKHYTGQPSPSLWHPTEESTITLPYGIIGFSKYSLERVRYNRTKPAIYHMRMTHPKLESILFANSKPPSMNHAFVLSKRLLMKWGDRWIRGFHAFFYKFNGKFHVYNVIVAQYNRDNCNRDHQKVGHYYFNTFK